MPTETVDPRFADIDTWPTERAIAAMLDGQRAAVATLDSQVATLAAAADAAAERLRAGGRLGYAGAGTSGRIAVQDGVELTPTYDWSGERMVFLLAGGRSALMESAEGAEDDVAAARTAIAEHGFGPNDVLIGVAASGRTPYTLAALEAARATGALTIAIADNPGTPLLAAADHAILADTGAEVIAGSTRMQAGTAQKVALNLLSTAIMLRLGRAHRGLMTNMRISNAKLAGRAQAIVAAVAEVDAATAAAALARADRSIPRAILLARGIDDGRARALLARTGDDVAAALMLANEA